MHNADMLRKWVKGWTLIERMGEGRQTILNLKGRLYETLPDNPKEKGGGVILTTVLY